MATSIPFILVLSDLEPSKLTGVVKIEIEKMESFFFFFLNYWRVPNHLDKTNPSGLKGKPGKDPCGPKVVELVDLTFDS